MPEMACSKINRLSRCPWVGGRFDLVSFDRSSRRLDHLTIISLSVTCGTIIISSYFILMERILMQEKHGLSQVCQSWLQV